MRILISIQDEVDMFPHTPDEKMPWICFRERTGRMTSMLSSRAMLSW